MRYSINSVCFSPDGRLIASGGDDKLATIWDAKTGLKLGESFKGHSDRITSVCFSPDNKLIVTGSKDKLAIIWDVKTRARIGDTLKGHSA